MDVLKVFRHHRMLVNPAIGDTDILQQWNFSLTSQSQTGTVTTAATTQASPEEVGETIGRYQVIKELGRGGMGRVLLCHDPQVGREVAIKQLLFTDAEEVIRFRREAEAMASIESPRVIEIYEVSKGDPLYIAMPVIRGETLRAAMSTMDRVTAEKSMLELARGVADCHFAGLIHRDLKPANVMVDANGRLIIMDLGLGKRESANDLTQSGAILGTPKYMPYEQISGLRNEIGAHSDVFSVGVICFEMLVGMSPYSAPNPIALMQAHASAHQRGEYPGAAEELQKAGVDGALAAIVLKAMHPRLTDRYRDASELVGALEQYFRLRDELLVQSRLGAQKRKFLFIGASLLAAVISVAGALQVLSLQSELAAQQEAAEKAQAARIQAEGRLRAEELLVQESRARQEDQRAQIEATQKITEARELIAQGKWREAADLLTEVVASHPNRSDARQVLAEALDVLQDTGRIDQYLWLAERSDGVVKQDYLMQAVMGVDGMDDTNPEAIQAQLDRVDPIIGQMTGLHREVALVMRNLFAANKLFKERQLREGRRSWDMALATVPDLARRNHESWTTLFMVGLYQHMRADWSGCYQAMNEAARINPEYHMTLYWRQRARRQIAKSFGPEHSHRVYGELLAALQDLERLQVMRPGDPTMDIDHADCLIEISAPDLKADEGLRSGRINEAIRLLGYCESQLDVERFRPMAELVYLTTAKVHALRWQIDQNEEARSQARNYLDRARGVKSDTTHDNVYARVEELIR